MASKVKTVYICEECGYESVKWMGGGGRMSHEGSAGARSCRRRLICISKGPPSLHPLPQEWPEVRGFTPQPSASGDPGEGPLGFPRPQPPTLPS